MDVISESSSPLMSVTTAESAIQHLKGAKDNLIGASEEIKGSHEEFALVVEINEMIDKIDSVIGCIYYLIENQ